MNKNLKKITAVICAVNVFSAIIPAANLMITKAYASSSITNLKVKDEDDDTIYLYNNADCENNHRVDSDDLKPGNTYYTRQTASDSIKIDEIEGVDSDCVRVFNTNSSDKKGKEVGDDIDLSSGTNTIVVRVYSSDPGDIDYNSNTTPESEYKIRIKYSGTDDDDEDSGNVYLDSITLTPGNINFNMRTYSYDVNVPEDCSKITIRARPHCNNDVIDNYKVKINGIKVDKDDKFKDDVSLKEGENTVEIKVEDDDDDENIYTLNITRGVSVNDTATNSNNTSDIRANQWVQVNGIWKYNDAKGNAVKNSWIGNYYVKDDGSMAIGWLSNGGSWYYLGSDGAKKNGWQWVNGIWYYLNSEGKMQTGWIKDLNGKYYYLNSDGSMAYDTTIDGYKLGADGAWIGR